jgi:undecaprenyl-diphosphatase
MTSIQIVVLALVQGLTEFLPVSSSAHLILSGQLLGWRDQGLAFDVATHFGTLVAVLFYFRHDLAQMLSSLAPGAAGGAVERNRRLLACLALASVPALLVGFLLHGLVELYLRDVHVIAWSTIGFGLLLWLADRTPERGRGIEDVTWRSALMIGIAQVLALIPGTSRSGITITAGRFLGFGPDAAARFSFLLSIPVIAGAGVFGALQVFSGDAVIDGSQFLLAASLAALAGWLCIAAFLALIERVGLMPFVVYRLALGGLLLWLIEA